MYIFCSCHAGCMATERTYQTGKRRLPNTVDEPKNIGYYLESLRDIASRPDREDVLKEFFKETYV